MGIKIIGVVEDIGNFNVSRKFEGMGEGLLLLRLQFILKYPSPFHWLLESRGKPPLDIAVDSTNGAICYIKFFFQDETIKNITDIQLEIKEIQKGIPYFDISEFDEKKYYISEKGSMSTFIMHGDLYIFIVDAKIDMILNVDHDNALLFNEERFCVGLLIKNLSNSELKELMLSKILL